LKTEPDVKARAATLKGKALKKRFKAELSKTPQNCANSGQQGHADPRRCTMVCLIGSEDVTTWQGKECDDQVASECPDFSCPKTKDDVRREFDRELMRGKDVPISVHRIRELLWVLEGWEGIPEEEEEEISVGRDKSFSGFFRGLRWWVVLKIMPLDGGD